MGNAQDWCLASSVYPDVEVACLVAEDEDGVEDEENQVIRVKRTETLMIPRQGKVPLSPLNLKQSTSYIDFIKNIFKLRDLLLRKDDVISKFLQTRITLFSQCLIARPRTPWPLHQFQRPSLHSADRFRTTIHPIDFGASLKAKVQYSVTVTGESDISDLKELVHEKGIERHILAKDLVLLKVAAPYSPVL